MLSSIISLNDQHIQHRHRKGGLETLTPTPEQHEQMVTTDGLDFVVPGHELSVNNSNSSSSAQPFPFDSTPFYRAADTLVVTPPGEPSNLNDLPSDLDLINVSNYTGKSQAFIYTFTLMLLNNLKNLSALFM